MRVLGCGTGRRKKGNYISAYAEIATTFNDPELIVLALAELGYTPEARETAIPLRSGSGRYRTRQDWQDTTDPKRALQAEIVVRGTYTGSPQGPTYNDIGFKLGPDGTYSIIPSNFDDRSHNKTWAERVKFNYAEQNIMRSAKRQGLRVLGKPKVMPDGKLQYAFQGR